MTAWPSSSFVHRYPKDSVFEIANEWAVLGGCGSFPLTHIFDGANNLVQRNSFIRPSIVTPTNINPMRTWGYQ